MSADNYIFIRRKTNEVFYGQGDGKPQKIGRYRDLESAVDHAEEYIEKELDGFLELGIRFV